jgi:hypothetical protein
MTTTAAYERYLERMSDPAYAAAVNAGVAAAPPLSEEQIHKLQSAFRRPAIKARKTA